MSIGDIPLEFSDVQQLVSTSNIHKLYRSPEGLSAYHDFKLNLKKQGIDMTTNLLANQLYWIPPTTPLDTSAEFAISNLVVCKDTRPFANPNDIIITTNNFPYYLADSLTHLCVWVKSPMPADPDSVKGDISQYFKDLIELYVQKTFVMSLGLDRADIIWFKNWAALQSVKSIPHIHVIVRGMTQDQIDAVVGTPGIALDYEEFVLEPQMSSKL